MTHGLQDLLSEYADQAKPYDVRAKALASGRRRRAARRLGPFAVALLVVVALGLVGLRLRSELPPAGPARPTLPPRVQVNGYPRTITPDLQAPLLPQDRGVGSGVFIYRVPGNGVVMPRFYLVTGDGTQFRLEDPPPITKASFSVSPDHRWLVRAPTAASQLRLRDLRGVGTYEYVGSPQAWSPDGHWLVTAGSYPDTPPVVSLVDLTAPGAVPLSVDLTAFPGSMVTAVFANGDIGLSPINPDGNFELSIVDHLTGTLKRRIQVDLVAYFVHTGVRQTTVDPYPGNLVLTDSGLVLLQTLDPYGRRPVLIPHNVLVIDLESETVRYEWNVPVVPPSDVAAADGQTWVLIGMCAQGPLFEHRAATGTLSWELYWPETPDQLHLVTDLTPLQSLPTSG